MCAQQKAISNKIKIFGRQLVSNQSIKNLNVHKKPACYIIMPDSKLKTFWNVTVIVLLAYTSTVVPF